MDRHSEIPERVGPYRVLQLLGQGGMGAVYEAEELGPVRRRVAIKVVRAGLASSDVIARFEAERQALALMNHPGIAKVLHAGTTDAGEPYFTMELVRGLPITAFCDANRLSIAERIELFIAVCHAVQHAHQKGVVHRDLKPSNILINEQDGARQPKIIDFGVAKAVGQQLTEHTLVTLAGTAIGTAAYMSPEQADPTGVDVDTRADIYSLGVILYELLVGELPVNPADLGIHAFLARVASRQTDPLTPSARLGHRQDTGPIAFTRRTDSRRLQRDLRGDLDWIVMMAMHPDRTHRYPSASGLAADLRRHLNHEPVVARPPSTRDRAQKFVRRHRAGVAAAGVVLMAIVAGGVLAGVGFVRATRAERLAAREAQAAREVTGFLVGLFEESDPGRARGDTVTAREILERGAARIATQLAGQPLQQARLMVTLGTVHLGLAQYDEARRLLDDAVRIAEQELGPDDLLVADALRALGDVARAKGQLDWADTVYGRALAIRERAYGPEHVDVATVLAAIAALRYRQSRIADAESLYRVILPLDERLRAPDDPLRFRNLRGMAVVQWAQGHYAEAEPLFKRALELQQRVLGRDHYDVGGTLNNLGGTYYQLGRYQDALDAYERARPVLERSLSARHLTVVGLHSNIGETYWKLKRLGEAEPLLRQALADKERILAPGDASIANTLHALAGTLRDRGAYAEAEALYRRALEIREKTAATDRLPVAETLRDFAELMRRTGRPAEAARLEERAAELMAPR